MTCKLNLYKVESSDKQAGSVSFGDLIVNKQYCTCIILSMLKSVLTYVFNCLYACGVQ